MLFSIIFFHQVFLRPILTYSALLYSLSNLIYLTLKRYPSIEEEINVDQAQYDAKVENASVLLYAYIAVFFFITIDKLLFLSKWMPFWVEAYSFMLIWIVYRVDSLVEHHETYASFFERQEFVFKHYLRPFLKFAFSQVATYVLRGVLFVVESLVVNGLIFREDAGKMKRALDAVSLSCARAERKKKSALKGKRSRKTFHVLR